MEEEQGVKAKHTGGEGDQLDQEKRSGSPSREEWKSGVDSNTVDSITVNSVDDNTDDGVNWPDKEGDAGSSCFMSGQEELPHEGVGQPPDPQAVGRRPHQQEGDQQHP